MRLGADPGLVDLVAAQAGGNELVHVGTRQIQHEAIALSRFEPPGNVVRAVAGAAEGVHDLGPDLSAALPETRTDRGNQIVRIGSELLLKRGDGLWRRAEHGAAPASVSRGHDTEAAVRDEDGRAVGHADADGHVGIVADDHVGFRPTRCGRIASARDGDRNAMDLPDQPELGLVHADGC